MNRQSFRHLRFWAATVLALLVLSASSKRAVAQNTFPTPSGNVGIGTTAPSVKLEVSGTVAAPSSLATNPITSGTFVLSDTSGTVGAVMGTVLNTYSYDTYLQARHLTTGNTVYNLLLQPLGGNVGIGTTSPAARLSIFGGTSSINIGGNYGSGYNGIWLNGSTAATHYNLLSKASDGHLIINRPGGADISFVENDAISNLIIKSGGNVGLGTSTPAARLEILGANYSLPASSGTTQTGLITRFRDSRPSGDVVLDLGSAAGTGAGAMWLQSTDMRGLYANYNLLLNPNGGNVGIGTANPGYKLDVYGPSGNYPGRVASPDGFLLFGPANTGWSYFTTDRPRFYFNTAITVDTGNVGSFDEDLNLQTSGTTRLTINNSTGNVGIGTPSPGYKLDINGNTNVTGNITASGTINAKYQDVAEWVPSSEPLSAGTVVVLDSTKSNQVISSSVSYDTRVAGVISAQPGIALGEKGESKVLVATTGRVKVKVDASKGPIRIGDLLVTSDVPGMAMKSEPIMIGGRQIHGPGTLIGKALEPLEKGSGEILVLLSLQ